MSESYRRSSSSSFPKCSRSPSPPSQTYHRSSILTMPSPALVESVAGGAHYSGVKVDTGTLLKHRRNSSFKQHAEIKHYHQRILEDLTELYCCRPTREIFERSWNRDAEFENSLSKCKGFDEYAAQWFAMTKFLSHSEQISKRVMSSTHEPNRLIYHQVQEYTTRFWKKKKTIESIIVVDMDEDERIIRLVDQWDGQELPNWFGASFLRVLNAKATPWIFHIPKPSTM